MTKSDLIDIPAKLIHPTEKALLLDTENGQVWLPKASCEYDEETSTLTLRRALAEEKGLV